MRAYILCGGFGTRLKTVTQGGQKALVAVNGEPFLLGVLRQLAKAGLSHAVLCAHYRADQMADHLASLSTLTGVRLDLVVEAEPLGTGGALLNALQARPPGERFLVLNADTYLDADAYGALIGASGNTVLGVHVEDRSRYGSLTLDDSGHLLAIEEKGVDGPGLINGGVYAFTERTFAGQPAVACSLERDLLPGLLKRAQVAVHAYGGRFIDIGTPESLARFATEFHGGAA